MYSRIYKRIFDFIVAFIALICIGWFLIFIAIWLHWANKGAGAFFIQQRPGLHGKPFNVIKFKTMSDARDSDGKLLSDSERLTKVGKFIRKTSIDELPQLWNVLRGDMSFIGPRPLLMQYLPLYTAEQNRRHDVRPGITGWAQIHGRNLLVLSKKFEYDVWYVDNLSLSLDIKILLKTVLNVLKRSDIGEGAGNMSEVDDLNFAERIILD